MHGATIKINGSELTAWSEQCPALTSESRAND